MKVAMLTCSCGRVYTIHNETRLLKYDPRPGDPLRPCVVPHPKVQPEPPLADWKVCLLRGPIKPPKVWSHSTQLAAEIRARQLSYLHNCEWTWVSSSIIHVRAQDWYLNADKAHGNAC